MLAAWLVVLVASAICHGGPTKCDKQLENCRICPFPKAENRRANCPHTGYDCDGGTERFVVDNGPEKQDCDRITCYEKGAQLFIDGVLYEDLACANKTWRYGCGYALTLEQEKGATCFQPCDQCDVTVPSTQNGASAVEVVSVSYLTTCMSAYCNESTDLYGIKPGENLATPIGAEMISCKGGGLWGEDGYESVFCNPKPPTCSPPNVTSSACPEGVTCNASAVSVSDENVISCLSDQTLYVSTAGDSEGAEASLLKCDGTSWEGVVNGSCFASGNVFVNCGNEKPCSPPAASKNACNNYPGYNTCIIDASVLFITNYYLGCINTKDIDYGSLIVTSIDGTSQEFTTTNGLRCVDGAWREGVTDKIVPFPPALASCMSL